MLEDTWFLNLSIPTVPEATTGKSKSSAPTLIAKWERRKRPSYAPSIRSGCTMTMWSAKNMGILFGGVTDEDRHEETLESVFWNDLYGYQIPGKGRWVSMTLKRPKKKSGTQRKKKAPVPQPRRGRDEDEDSDGDEDDDEDDEDGPKSATLEKQPTKKVEVPEQPEVDPDDPNLTTPLPRYNTMLAVLRNTLYIYGGIFEKGSREYTLDDFHYLQLDKLDRYVCLKESGVTIAEGDESSSDDDDDEDDEDDEDDGDDDAEDEDDGENEDGEGKDQGEEEAEAEEALESANPVGVEEEWEVVEEQDKVELRMKATAFMGVAKDTTRSAEDIISTPLPGETLAMFYGRSREHWSAKAHEASENRGKELRRHGFALAEERYASYKPILEEVEKILAEAGLDEEEMRRGAAAGPLSPAASGQSRNRR
ncbi:hypothetical protein H0H92_007147 [Tricholoma furcatifolium]|nr:hypothetical protein H0H92_007147 [Tricholoma furcatifolium]